jgi:hypothetical protein
VSLNAAGSELALDDGERLRYDRLLLTTGAEPRPLSIPGGELDGVLYLRSVEDCDALRHRLEHGGALVVIGAGWIGAEAAASARQRGLEVTVLDPTHGPARARARRRGGRRLPRPPTQPSSPRPSPARTPATTSFAPQSPPACATRGSSSSSSRSTTSAMRPTCCAPPTRRATDATGSSHSNARMISPTTPRPPSSRQSGCGVAWRGPNVIIKVPATEAGIPAIEELTARGDQRQHHAALLARALRAPVVPVGDRRGLEHRRLRVAVL